MIKYFLLFLFLITAAPTLAGHIAGGEIFYSYLSPGNTAGTNRYRITLRLFRECFPPAGGQPTAELPTQVWLAIFNNASPYMQHGGTHTVNINGPKQIISLGSPNPCITNPPQVCYEVGNFSFETDLPGSVYGYIASFQTCCRTNNISNIGGFSVGATYTAEIPGTAVLGSETNSSAVFALKDTTLVCRNSAFSLDFSATDADRDSLSYAFCNAYNGGPTTNSANVTPSKPPYGTILYSPDFSGASPLGSSVSINPVTGIISGIAPEAGSYVVTVCVSEWRKGQLISVHRKDFTLKIGDCSLSAAELKPDYISCDGFTLSFENESASPTNTSYTWEFGDPASGAANVSNNVSPTHTYSDTGVYKLQLRVQNSVGCRDTAEALVRVFPGFFPAFDVAGSCFQTPIRFFDRTTATYGFINSWKWNFGDNINDTSSIKNPTRKYATAGQRKVILIVGSSKGCRDTIDTNIDVNDVPLLRLPFSDTLICSGDTLPLIAEGNGVFSWTPTLNMLNNNTANPLVFPNDTTRYIVTLNENGCIKSDTINVNVVDFVTVDVGPDTSLCLTDSIVIPTKSYALHYSWTPGAGLNRTDIKSPVAKPDASSIYYVRASLGHCFDLDTIAIKVAPFPGADAGPDAEICFGSRTSLNGSITGSSFTWSPSTSLQNATTLQPVAGPGNTTSYILSVYDTLGCPKPFRDTVVVAVLPPVAAFAGRDTLIVANQPLKLRATGGSSYSWSPATGMNDPLIADPTITLPASIDSIRYVVRVTTSEGCSAEDDIKVIVFKTPPDIFVPSAFTPNADGKNDVLRPKPVGIRLFYHFNIYNRWGQLVFSSSDPSDGWDGTINGKDQPTNTFIYTAEGADYMGNTIKRKGTVVLIK